MLSRLSVRPTIRGFTLIELLISVALLMMIILISSFIFDSTIKAVGHSQANGELTASVAAFHQILNNDLRGMEHDGYLLMGARQQRAFGSSKDRANGRVGAFRTDWMECFVNSELYSAVDPRVIGQWSRIFYGHGVASQDTHASYSQVATDWVLLRQQWVELAQTLTTDIQTAAASYYNTPEVTCVETAGKFGEPRWYAGYGYCLRSYAARNFQWYMMKLTWNTVPVMFDEPTYYVDPANFYWGDSAGRRLQLLPNCAEFRVQFAMPQDLRHGDGDVIRWRDPPILDVSYEDLNHCPGDTLHPDKTLTSGRLAFGPGDRWPVLLRIRVRTFDPLDRFDGGRWSEVIVRVP